MLENQLNFISNKEQKMLDRIKDCIQKADKIYFIVSFIMDSGLKLLINELNNARSIGKEIKILTSDYINVTEPSALYRLMDYKGTRIYNNPKNISFHPKAYIFTYPNGHAEAFIGSSNISYSALSSGIEWNYCVNKKENPDIFSKIIEEFHELYEENSFLLSIEWLREYEKRYKKKNLKLFDDQVITSDSIEPVKFQIGALYELSKTREEGFKKALVIVATGLGKTYLSAFDSLSFNRILFIAHRKEILDQAFKTFIRVHGSDKSYGFFRQEIRNTNCDITFASVQTLKNYLTSDYFDKNAFDYIVVDEFHHATAGSYKKVLDYFNPKFLLGLTATPDRNDNGDIFELCDNNIAYVCNLKTGINSGWLVPFEYFGIYDDTDYDTIPWRNGNYDLNSLENALILEKRMQEVYSKYCIYKKKHTIAFCAGVRHCHALNEYFAKKGEKCDLITGSTALNDRDNILQDFKNGRLSILFVVDVFNEGVDIPQIDMVMFLRPTSSYTIFIQQLGRGLRTCDNKEKLRILDFVGNYKYSYVLPMYLTGEPVKDKSTQSIKLPNDLTLPEGCSAHFDFQYIEYLEKIKTQSIRLEDKLKNEYLRIKETLQRKPSILEFYYHSNIPVSTYSSTYGSWLDFLDKIDETDDHEKTLLSSNVSQFLKTIEKTPMTKSYKMPVLLSFFENNTINQKVHIDSLCQSFKAFYLNLIYQTDVKVDFQHWTFEQVKNHVLKNPVNALLNTGSDFFSFENDYFSIKPDFYDDLINLKCYQDFKERVSIRLNDYFKRKYNQEL